MTKWFDTNYHYLVPEFDAATRFRLASGRLLAEVAQARSLGHRVKVALIGPLSFLWLGKTRHADVDRRASPYAVRQAAQQARFNLPSYPTTTICSFPQTTAIRAARAAFKREDQPHSTTALQIALAIRDEASDLEAAGIGILQIDEPALREGLPPRRAAWPARLDWSTHAFRVAACGVRDDTQLHTHMCYAEFNDILPQIAALDADVITIETSRSDMELLRGFGDFGYPNAIGPGVYDIHSPRVPSAGDILRLMRKAADVIPARQLWVNPDCGLKTRGWAKTRAALANMVEAARLLCKEAAWPGGGVGGEHATRGLRSAPYGAQRFHELATGGGVT